MVTIPSHGWFTTLLYPQKTPNSLMLKKNWGMQRLTCNSMGDIDLVVSETTFGNAWWVWEWWECRSGNFKISSAMILLSSWLSFFAMNIDSHLQRWVTSKLVSNSCLFGRYIWSEDVRSYAPSENRFASENHAWQSRTISMNICPTIYPLVI